MSDTIVQSLVGNISNASVALNALKLQDELTQALTRGSPITMLPNYHIEPLGQEKGEYVVVDVGGSTLRVSIVLLKEGGAGFEVLVNRLWAVRDSFKKMDRAFFQWIGDKISEVLHQPEAELLISCDTGVDLGLSWSFPLEQTHYNRGLILHAGKGFDVGPEIEGKDLNDILTQVMKEDYNITINVDCIINDSLAVYAASAFLHSTTSLGCVLGTGLNMCVPLKTALFPDFKSVGPGHQYGLFNSEVSLFGSSFVSPYVSQLLDPHIDDRFANIGELSFELFMEKDHDGRIFQPLELLTSGRYLQELTRLAIVQMYSAGEVLAQIEDITCLTDPLNRYEGFPGALVCFINENNDIAAIAEQLAQSFSWDSAKISSSDVTTIKTVVDAIIKRAAFIVAVVVVAFVGLLHETKSLGDTQVLTMGYVGLVLQYYNSYRGLILQYVNDNVGQYGVTVEFEFIDNSTLVGTAVSTAYFKNLESKGSSL